MERFRNDLQPIQKVGTLLWKRSRDLGVTKVMNKHIERVENAFNSIYKIRSVRSIIDSTNPNFSEGSYLIFNPHVRPERSTCWINVPDPKVRLSEIKDIEKWSFDTFMDSHYLINVPYRGKTKGVVYGCFDEHGTLYL